MEKILAIQTARANDAEARAAAEKTRADAAEVVAVVFLGSFVVFLLTNDFFQ